MGKIDSSVMNKPSAVRDSKCVFHSANTDPECLTLDLQLVLEDSSGSVVISGVKKSGHTVRSEQFVWWYQSCESERVSLWLCWQILALWVTLHLGNVHGVHIGCRVFLYYIHNFIFQVISWDKLLKRFLFFFSVVGHVLLITSRNACGFFPKMSHFEDGCACVFVFFPKVSGLEDGCVWGLELRLAK